MTFWNEPHTIEDYARDLEEQLKEMRERGEGVKLSLQQDLDLAHATIDAIARKLTPWIQEDDVAIDALVIDAVDRLLAAFGNALANKAGAYISEKKRAEMRAASVLDYLHKQNGCTYYCATELHA